MKLRAESIQRAVGDKVHAEGNSPSWKGPCKQSHTNCVLKGSVPCTLAKILKFLISLKS